MSEMQFILSEGWVVFSILAVSLFYGLAFLYILHKIFKPRG